MTKYAVISKNALRDQVQVTQESSGVTCLDTSEDIKGAHRGEGDI